MRFSHFVAGLTFAAVSAVVAGASAVPSDAHYARGATNIFWFMHVTDTHIGTCLATDWDARFRRVFTYSKVINPWFIMLTGDLVEGAKNTCIPTMGQSQNEWDQYISIYEDAKVTPSFFFDLPGNHDAYNDKGMTYYLKNSLQGRTNGEPFVSWTVDLPLGQYLFLGLNSVGNGSGPTFEEPEFLDDQMDKIRQVIEDHSKARLRIFAAHHHLTGKGTTTSPLPVNADKVIDLMKSDGGSYYLHGHRHECGEYLLGDGNIIVNQLNTLGKGKEDNIGIVAIDHDGFTYRVTNSEDPWPLVIVTAPWGMDLRGDPGLGDQSPDGRINPNAYPVCKDRTDNPVRALVFSDEPPTSVTAMVHGAEPVEMKQSKVAPQIWEAEVDTTSVVAGTTSVKVVAKVKGKKDAEHSIRVKLENGPCENDLPIDPDPGTGGTGGEGGAGGGDAGGSGGSGGSVPIGGAGGEESSGGGGDSGSGGAAGEAEGGASGSAGVAGTAGKAGSAGSGAGGKSGVDSGMGDGSTDLRGDSDGGGCSCEIGVGASNGASRTIGTGWVALLGLAALAVRRRRAQS